MESNDRRQGPRRENTRREGKKDSVRLLTVIQIVGCLIVLGAAVLLRAFGGDVYDTVRDWYLETVGDSIVTDDQISGVKRAVVGLWPPSSSESSGVSSAPPQASSDAGKGTASQALSSAQGGASAGSSVSSAGAASK